MAETSQRDVVFTPFMLRVRDLPGSCSTASAIGMALVVEYDLCGNLRRVSYGGRPPHAVRDHANKQENEHLGLSDAGPATMRQLLLKTVRDLMDGKDPPGIAYRPEDNDLNIDVVHAMLPPGVNWKDVKAVQANLLTAESPQHADLP